MRTRTPSAVDPREQHLLRAYVLRRDYAWVIAHPDAPLTAVQRRRLNVLLAERAQGAPLAYGTGAKEFYGRVFSVGPGVLVPRQETEHLVENVLKHTQPSYRGTIADIGTGTGCLAITLALERPRATILGIDRSSRAIAYAMKNARRLSVTTTTFYIGDMTSPLVRRSINPDIIVANLPYATPSEYTNVRSEPRSAIVGGNDGMTAFRRFFISLRLLRAPSMILLEIDPRRLDKVLSLAHASFPSMSVSVEKDLAGHDRIVTLTRQ